MSKKASKSPSWRSWTGMVYYGEAVGFVAAWAAGIFALSNAAPTKPTAPLAIDQVAVAETPAAVAPNRPLAR